MTDDCHPRTVLNPGADSCLRFEASSRQKEGSGAERYVWESNNFTDVAAAELVSLRGEVRDCSMTESSNLFHGISKIKASSYLVLVVCCLFHRETKYVDRIHRPQKNASKRYFGPC